MRYINTREFDSEVLKQIGVVIVDVYAAYSNIHWSVEYRTNYFVKTNFL